jgi:hypothetical protein
MKRMKTILLSLIAFALSLGMSRAEVYFDDCRIPVFGEKTIRLPQHLAIDNCVTDQVMNELSVAVETCHSPGEIHFMVNGIELGHIDIPAQHKHQRHQLTLPFRVLYEPGMELELKIDGRMTIAGMGMSFGRDLFREPPPIVVRPVSHYSPPREIRSEVSCGPSHWSTRYQGAYCEQVSTLADRGDGVRDGWDYPNRGLVIDGATAKYRSGYKTSALTAYFRDLAQRETCDEVTAVTLRIRMAGRGQAQVELGCAGKSLRQTTVGLSSQLRTVELRLDGLHVHRDQLNDLTLAVRNPEGQEMEIDGMEITASVVQHAPVSRRY